MFAKIIYSFGTKLFILRLVSLLCTCAAMAQAKQMKSLTADDYHRWGTLNIAKLSDSGQWVSYNMDYDSNDTLIVKRTAGSTTFNFPGGIDGNFGGENWFACRLPNKQLEVLNLIIGERHYIENTLEYSFFDEGKYLATLLESGDSKKLVVSLTGGVVIEIIENVTSISFNQENNALLYATASSGMSSVGILSFKKIYSKTRVTDGNNCKFHNLNWHTDGKAVAFLKEVGAGQNDLIFYVRKSKGLYSAPSTDIANLQASMRIDPAQLIRISSDCKKLFFYTKIADLIPLADTVVQIWNGNDKWIYPMQQTMGKWNDYGNIVMWQPETGKVTQVTTREQPYVMLGGNEQFAILSNPKDYEPQYKQDGSRDYYILDFRTFEKRLFLKQQSGSADHMSCSPNGKYVAYYRDDSWYVYNVMRRIHTKISPLENQGFTFENSDPGAETFAHGSPGWSDDGETFLLYDKNDIWSLPVNGSIAKRLTHGREKNLIFRVSSYSKSISDASNFNGSQTSVLNLHGDIVLSATHQKTGATGFYKWKMNGGEAPMAFGNSLIDEMQISTGGKTFVYREQTFADSPVIKFKTAENKVTIVSKSNEHQKLYSWGFSKMVHYKSSVGEDLNAALFFPAGYDANKRYPVIVWIYEKQARDIHWYVNPSLYNMEGINISNLTSQGYFVLLSDIAYENGKVGYSALDCVKAAVDAAIVAASIDKYAMGLTGHSFGGYETDFIITQTDMFAAAVAGSAVTELTSMNFGVNWGDAGKANMWRFENQQFRMGKSFYEDRTAYLSNSPLWNAQNIVTPLLSWSGTADENVPWDQSIAFYLALRRLNKRQIMLAYPNAAHVLMDGKQQYDLTRRIEEWFGHFLKGEMAADWITDGIKLPN